ncbi:hypothetical protein [Enterovibrio baiacu]|uniref:hypothetical protein n=1 Tax=Enterovibrio baiacu TaxID=2491023 RepID=UPI0010132E61|nr:hypothetical protein [Enterovibrio baiacu]MBE1276849.1 hypothetical protein [Enterovibrio baiacu]
MNIGEVVEGTMGNVKQRLSSPFFGALLIAWLWENHRGIGVFLFSEADQRLEIISNYDITSEYGAIVSTFLFAMFVFYFVMPAIQFLYQWTYRLFLGVRLSRALLEQDKAIIDDEVEAEKEYRRKLKFDQLGDWKAEKVGMSSKIEELEFEINSLRKELNFHEDNFKDLSNSSESRISYLQDELQSTRREVSEYTKRLKKHYTSLDEVLCEAEKTIGGITPDSIKLSTIRKVIAAIDREDLSRLVQGLEYLGKNKVVRELRQNLSSEK